MHTHDDNIDQHRGGYSQHLLHEVSEHLKKLATPHQPTTRGAPHGAPCPPLLLDPAACLGEQPNDSGYGSAITCTPEPRTAEPSPSSSHEKTRMVYDGLYAFRTAMDPATYDRLAYVQTEITKLLPKVISAVPGRQKSVAIRPAMLGSTADDAAASPYMVVFCSDNLVHTVRDFFKESEVQALCRPPDGDALPSFEILVTRQIRLRAATPDVTVYCEPYACHDGWDVAEWTRPTFCGMPIRVDSAGHSRNATFGGMVKVTEPSGVYKLYGLTAGHVTKAFEASMSGEDLESSGESEIDLDSQERSDEVSEGDCDLSGPWSLHGQHALGRLIRPNLPQQLECHQKPYLDWALFEVDTYKPNQLAAHGDEFPRDELHLPPALAYSQSEIRAAMVSGSQGLKRGTLSMTRVSVLLDPGETFTDAYTMSLDDSEVVDGDSGSWVVDEAHLDVYGHVIADDVFGDAYVVPMPEILNDIRRFFDAGAVDLASYFDVLAKTMGGLGGGDWYQDDSDSGYGTRNQSERTSFDPLDHTESQNQTYFSNCVDE